MEARKKKLPIGIENFEEIRTKGFYYVDKTGLIKELLENWGKVTLFTRPRRFGKSLNMSMLKSFFELGGRKEIFEGLEISKEVSLCEEYMGKFPVISISLKGIADKAEERRMNTELKEALQLLGKERNIPEEALLEAIQNSLLIACKNHFGKSDNIIVNIDPDTYEYKILQQKEAVETVEDPVLQISLADARMIEPKAELGDVINIEIDSRKFGRIATQNAKGVIVQKIKEEERNSVYNEFASHEHSIMTGIVQRFLGKNISINLGQADAILAESEQVKGETYRPQQRLKVYVLEVKNNPRGPRISVSRTHPDLVRCLFEQEVSEVKDGTVEIKAIAREAGSRTKMAVLSNDENVDPVGACVGVNGVRVNAVVDELHGEKIDIINWDDNPAYLIENALSPAKVICVVADEDNKEAKVIVPDFQLSLAIGKEGQNARLAAKLTGYKIDIKSETQAQESGLFEELGMEVPQSGEEDEYYAETLARKLEASMDEEAETDADTDADIENNETDENGAYEAGIHDEYNSDEEQEISDDYTEEETGALEDEE